ncbi:Pseudouridylate synthases, 23S RNA-specific [Hahella chejuensis KCTC 2396]|uniref:Pseudouridylate synthases, 23S RNA-specific n=1 Tax=Hahella chejuensis (strain KCTC 2396) TaxID=349521 RepID=Q2SKD2_HAHCH|nr:TIGR01621 family pseudouridine synthase [Hahella chejuensis]ABC28892.1 Pseudouridylate synthases, 23S RNA-specific [Hahella chejuensis KCTC 2396]
MNAPPFQIVSDYDDLLVVDKAPGISFHDEEGQPGLCSCVADTLGIRVYPVHRLDKVTSGLLLLPKTPALARELTEQFSLRQVEKYYLALSAHKPQKKQGKIIGDMEKARAGAWKLTAGRENPAVTQFFSHSLQPGVRAFMVRPLTGKTHQIRVALKSVSAPIAGDSLYGGRANKEFDRTYLHAYGVRFNYRGNRTAILCPPQNGALFVSEAMSALLEENWGAPWDLPWPGR